MIRSSFLKKNLFGKYIAETLEIVRIHNVFIFIVIIYVCTLGITSIYLKIADRISLSLYNYSISLTITLFLITFFMGYTIYVMVFVRPRKLYKYLLNNILAKFIKRERILNALLIIFCLSLFMSAFTTFKTLIPVTNPYSWDPTFAKIDTAIHGGFQPWQLLHPVIGFPLLTSVINFFYNLWFFIMFFVVYWQAFSLRDLKLRMQFFISFVLIWGILGTFFATLFSSVGPCYYDKVVIGSDIYIPLMNYLNNANEFFPIWSLNAQKMLWEIYENNEINLGGGISAMPSLHVAASFLFTLVGWQYHRILGIIFGVFTLIIMIGSVHLAWHYAIDGYFSVIFTGIIWHIVGYFLGKNQRIIVNTKQTL